MTTFTIIKHTSDNAPKQYVATDIRISIDKRNPARTYSMDIPVTMWHGTQLDTVPAQFRPLVQASLICSAEAILKTYLDTANRDQTQIPCEMFTLDALLARNTTGRMTAELLLGMWKQTHKYIMGIAPKLTELTGNTAKLAAYKSRLELHEKRLTALTTKSPETKLSNADLDKILINMDEVDFDTDYGAYVAERVEYVRGKLTEDSDAL